MWAFLLFIALDGTPVEITTLDGTTQSGQLTNVTASDVTIRKQSSESAVPTSQMMSLSILHETTSSESTTSEEPQEIWLHDGSHLRCASLKRTAQLISAAAGDAGELMIPADFVRAVRLQAAEERYQTQWKSFLERKTEKDLLIVPKRDGEGLDFLAGIVSTITADELTFLLDGESISVPAGRAYGVVFASSPEKAARLKILVHLADYQQVGVDAVTFSDQEFNVRTSWGQELRISQKRIRSIDYSAGRIHYLSDLPPISETFSGIDPEGSLFTGLVDPETIRLMYGPRRDTAIDTQLPIRLRGRTYARGLCIHSRTELTFALDRKYTSLETLVGVDDEVARNQDSKVSLKISGDGQVLIQREIGTRDAAFPVRLPLDGVTTLTILVDFADNDSSCDWLDLADAKLILATENP